MKPIGVFDSGVGGLTVVKELLRQLPGEEIVYFGDTARVPYGIKSKETVIRFSIENILFLLKHEVKLICVACNTVSSFALAEIKNNFKVPIVGVIRPGAQEAVSATRNKRIGIIGTKGTVKSRAYENEIKQLDPAVKVIAAPCPLFVPFVEEGWLSGNVVRSVVKYYLKPLKKAGIDTLILGCTHYPLLKNLIKDELGKKVILIDSARQVAIEVSKILAGEGLLRKAKQGEPVCPAARHKFFVSDNPEWFSSLAERFLGRPVKNVKRVNNV
ncbi:MAG: glutamate racemase [Candidatus Omnitrophota bacterium]